MKRVTTLVILGSWLAAAGAFAQATPPQTPPAAQAQKPAAPAAAATAFPEGSRIAIVDVQLVANQSAEGKAATAKILDFQQKKTSELAAKNKALEAAQQKMTQSGSVMSEDARAQLQKEIDKQQLDIQRAQQDAQTELDELNRQLNTEFQRKLAPIIQQVAGEKGLYVLFSRGTESGIVWAEEGLNLTAEIIRRFDALAAAGKTPAPKPPKL